MLRQTTLASLALIATVAATPASARDVPVRYHDLDLATERGRAELDTRIHRAARRACGDAPARRTLQESAAIGTCIARARESAHSRMATTVPVPARGG